MGEKSRFKQRMRQARSDYQSGDVKNARHHLRACVSISQTTKRGFPRVDPKWIERMRWADGCFRFISSEREESH